MEKIRGLRYPLKNLRTQYQVQNETEIRKNRKVSRNNNDELLVKPYPKKKQQKIQQSKHKPPNCPSCKGNKKTQFSHSFLCQTLECEFIIIQKTSNR